MAYRLLALNIDGTLLLDNGRIHKLTKEAIDYAQKKKVTICLYSGREYSAVKRAAKALKADSCLIAHQGAYIASDLDKPMYINRISEDHTFEICQLLESFDCQITLESEKFSVSNKGRLPVTIVKRNMWQRTQKLLYSQYFVESLTSHLLEERISPLKINVKFYKKHDIENAKQAIQNMFDEVSFLTKENGQLEIIAAGVSKWNGLVYLAEQLGIKRSEIAVIGCGEDDEEAVSEAAIGIAMGNAHEKVKAAADWITRTNEDNGISYVIKELLRHQQSTIKS